MIPEMCGPLELVFLSFEIYFLEFTAAVAPSPAELISWEEELALMSPAAKIPFSDV